MAFCWSTLRVNNMDESLSFYKDVIGLALQNRFNAGPDLEIAFLGDGETKIELVCNKDSSDVKIGSDISLGFEIDSVNEKMNSIKNIGINIESGPFQPNANIKFFYILDPNGLKIQLIEKIK
ncbi:MAG: VOC family protein [Eubacteriales bacterium]|nr:VOC family protein [Eubacteriales bacterium]MDD3198296.1 VOC family protein [Eubacteriales bacterium]MDD3504357.1 VOC family protein [Eubacteriales bacterium]MDD4682798.1 VOC family protein [Eubacteriales bacterium]